MNYGFIKTAASSLKLKVADVSFNTSIIKEAIDSALEKNVKLLVTPELSVTGYTCADLFFARTLLIESERAVAELADYIKGKDIVLLVGAPVPFFNKLYNCAVVIDKDGVKGIVPKKHLANYNEFYEKRWFASGFDFKEVQSISYAGFDTQIGDIVFDCGCLTRQAVFLLYAAQILLLIFRQATNTFQKRSIAVNLWLISLQGVFALMFIRALLFLKVQPTLFFQAQLLCVKTERF